MTAQPKAAVTFFNRTYSVKTITNRSFMPDYFQVAFLKEKAKGETGGAKEKLRATFVRLFAPGIVLTCCWKPVSTYDLF